MKMIMFFNLKTGVDEEVFLSKAGELFRYLDGKVDGMGAVRLYKHAGFGANPRTYQIHSELREYAALDRLLNLMKSDGRAASLFEENWWKLIDMDAHYDEFVRELPLP